MTTDETPPVGQGDFTYQPLPGWDQLPEGWSYLEVVGAATDSAGNLYAFNRGEHPVIVLDAEGNFLRAWGEGEFQRPHGIWVAPDDTLWLTDDVDHTIHRYSPEGERLSTMGISGQPSDTGVENSDYRTLKQPAGPFNQPTNLAVAPDGRLFITDGYGNCRVHRFSSDGEFEMGWGEPGNGPGQFHLPHGICVDSAGVVFVADRENSRLQLFDDEGSFLEEWTDVARPCEVFLDSDDTVYVAELGWHAGTNDQRLDETGGSAFSIGLASCCRGSAVVPTRMHPVTSRHRTISGSTHVGTSIPPRSPSRQPFHGAWSVPIVRPCRNSAGSAVEHRERRPWNTSSRRHIISPPWGRTNRFSRWHPVTRSSPRPSMPGATMLIANRSRLAGIRRRGHFLSKEPSRATRWS